MTNQGGLAYRLGMTEGPLIKNDGWISCELDDDLRVHLHVAMRDDVVVTHGDAVVVNGLYIHADEITTETFRRVHPARILAAVNQLDDEQIWERTEGGVRLSDEYKRSAAFAVRLVAFSSPGDAGLAIDELRARAEGRRIVERPREPLGRPGTDPALLDDFYRRVADAYTSASVGSGRPASALAEENRVPINTVYKWVREARRRGHLEPGRQGKVG